MTHRNWMFEDENIFLSNFIILVETPLHGLSFKQYWPEHEAVPNYFYGGTSEGNTIDFHQRLIRVFHYGENWY